MNYNQKIHVEGHEISVVSLQERDSPEFEEIFSTADEMVSQNAIATLNHLGASEKQERVANCDWLRFQFRTSSKHRGLMEARS